jgi:hypothetical protein
MFMKIKSSPSLRRDSRCARLPQPADHRENLPCGVGDLPYDLKRYPETPIESHDDPAISPLQSADRYL